MGVQLFAKLQNEAMSGLLQSGFFVHTDDDFLGCDPAPNWDENLYRWRGYASSD